MAEEPSQAPDPPATADTGTRGVAYEPPAGGETSARVAERIEEIPAADGAVVMEGLSPGQAADVAEYLDPTTAGHILSQMDPTAAASVITDMETPEASMVLEAMDPDDRVDIL